MFSKKVTDDDNFMSLSASAQALYFHLSMSADDDGFSNQVTSSMFKAHASVSDLEQLLEKRYIFRFDDGVIVIKHWRMSNALRKDRYTPTAFQEDMAKLGIKDNGSYTWLPNGCQLVAERLPQDSIGKVSKGKDSSSSANRFTKPSIDDVRSYCNERHNNVDAQRFYDYYTANGWKVGKNPMKDWKACVRTWERNTSVNTTNDTIPTYSTDRNTMMSTEDEEELLKLMGRTE